MDNDYSVFFIEDNTWKANGSDAASITNKCWVCDKPLGRFERRIAEQVDINSGEYNRVMCEKCAEYENACIVAENNYWEWMKWKDKMRHAGVLVLSDFKKKF